MSQTKLWLLVVIFVGCFASVTYSSPVTYGACPNGYHYCEMACPFIDPTFCDQAGVACSDGLNITAECLNIINQYCLDNDDDPGCCNGTICEIPQLCLPPGETCKSGVCEGRYYCGYGQCRDNLQDPCPPNSYCPGAYTCKEDICSTDPLKCSPATSPFQNCPSGHHYCPTKCPFQNNATCEQLGPYCSEGITTECADLITQYCEDNSTDSGCCDGFLCPDYDFVNCYDEDTPCGKYNECPGQFYCGNGQCRASLYDPCPSGTDCSGSYPCASGSCTNDPIDCSEENGGGFEEYGECPNGYHYCGEMTGCPYDNSTFCDELGQICPLSQGDCQNLQNAYCQKPDNANDKGCCSGIPCDLRCSPFNITCPGYTECAGNYFCGIGSCRGSLYSPCYDDFSQCPGRFPCGNGLCSQDPLQCQPPIDDQNDESTCPIGFHYCEVSCPFSNMTVCFFLSLGPCKDGIGQECVEAANEYCATNPNEVACCGGLVCSSFNATNCFEGGATCGQFTDCPGNYDCGNKICTGDLYEPCPPGSKCPGGFYCGDRCVVDPLDCNSQSPPPTGSCAPGYHYCGDGCPLQDAAACLTIADKCDSGDEEGDEISTTCLNAIQEYCTNNPNDPSCCNGFLCDTQFSGCFSQDYACPPVSSCGGKYYCGNGQCRDNLLDPCPATSECSFNYPCGNDLCSAVPTQCQPPLEPVTKGYCPEGQHYCGGSCPFTSENACKEFFGYCGDESFWSIEMKKRQSNECYQFITEYCWNNTDCCDGWLCKPQEPLCVDEADACPTNSACPNQYSCGYGYCRQNLDQPCNEGPCIDSYYCGNGACSEDPLHCQGTESSSGSCENGFHVCPQGCPFQNMTFCAIAGDVCGDIKSFDDAPTACVDLVNDYCSNINPSDTGCCGGTICVVKFFDSCFQPDTPCNGSNPCVGKYDCGYGLCRDKLYDPCPVGSACPFSYFCGDGICSVDPLTCGQVVSPPQQGICPPGQHFCGNVGCPFEDMDICNTVADICDEDSPNFDELTCYANIQKYCTVTNPSDKACCNGFLCVNDIGRIGCTPKDQPCAENTNCPGQYYCGESGTCRDSLDTPCQDGECQGQFPCGNSLCSFVPTQCQPPVLTPIVNGDCANNTHTCGYACPFSNATFCKQLDDTVCSGGVTPACLEVAESYCSNVNPNDRGCCKGNTPYRCTDTGACAADEESCPQLTASNYLCVSESSTCPNASPCAGQYDCGNNICKRTMTEVCPPGSSCPGRYYCGEDVCSDDPLQCSPPVGIPRPSCANGGIVCKLTEECQEFNGISVCACKGGFTRDLKGECSDPDQGGNINSGCYHDVNGTVVGCGPNMDCERKPGTNNGNCVCRNNYVYNPNTGGCDEKPPPIIAEITQCQAMGDPHYYSFTQQYFDFQTKCDYVAARNQDLGLEVHVRQGDCGRAFDPHAIINPSIACIRAVAFKTGVDVVEFAEDGLYVNGALYVGAYPYVLASGVTITSDCANYYAGTCFKALYPDDTEIEYAQFSFTIRIGASYFENVHGVCGYWNGATPGYVLRNGTELFNQPNPPHDFAEDWIVSETENLFRFENPECFKNATTEIERRQTGAAYGCDTSAQLDVAFEVCERIFEPGPPYDECFKALDTARYFTACVFDYCAAGDSIPSIAEFAVAGFKAQCVFEVAKFLPPETTEDANTGLDTNEESGDETGKETGEETEEPATQDELSSSNIVNSCVALIIAVIAIIV